MRYLLIIIQFSPALFRSKFLFMLPVGLDLQLVAKSPSRVANFCHLIMPCRREVFNLRVLITNTDSAHCFRNLPITLYAGALSALAVPLRTLKPMAY